MSAATCLFSDVNCDSCIRHHQLGCGRGLSLGLFLFLFHGRRYPCCRWHWCSHGRRGHGRRGHGPACLSCDDDQLTMMMTRRHNGEVQQRRSLRCGSHQYVSVDDCLMFVLMCDHALGFVNDDLMILVDLNLTTYQATTATVAQL